MGLTRIDQAVIFAAKAHDGQRRKASDIPYITHPFNVAMLLSDVGCSQAVIIAGVLHDTIEDTEVTYEDIEKEFGEEVAMIIYGCTEPEKNLSWEERKEHTIGKLGKVSVDVCLVVCADKVNNLRSMVEELRELGDDVWKRFKRGREKQAWYYKEIRKKLEDRIGHHPLWQQLNNEVQRLFEKD